MHLEYRKLVQDTLLFLKQENLFHFPENFLDEPIVDIPKASEKAPLLKEAIAPKIVEDAKPVIENKKPEEITPIEKPLPLPKTPPPKPPLKKASTKIYLEPPKKEVEYLEDVKKDIQKIAPSLDIHEGIPSDIKAKRIAFSYKYKNQASDITIFTLKEDPLTKKFLQNIAKAIDIYFFPTSLIDIGPIDKQNLWEGFLSAPQLKLIISSDYAIWEQKNLMTYFKEYPSRSQTFLGKVPLLLLPDLSLYLKDPLLKSSLWKALCQKIRPLQT